MHCVPLKDVLNALPPPGLPAQNRLLEHPVLGCDMREAEMRGPWSRAGGGTGEHTDAGQGSGAAQGARGVCEVETPVNLKRTCEREGPGTGASRQEQNGWEGAGGSTPTGQVPTSGLLPQPRGEQTSSVICPLCAKQIGTPVHPHPPLARLWAAALRRARGTEWGAFLPGHGAQGLTAEPQTRLNALRGNNKCPTFIARAIRAPSVGCPTMVRFRMEALLATQPA